jgi:hypothetical protein
LEPFDRVLLDLIFFEEKKVRRPILFGCMDGRKKRLGSDGPGKGHQQQQHFSRAKAKEGHLLQSALCASLHFQSKGGGSGWKTRTNNSLYSYAYS